VAEEQDDRLMARVRDGDAGHLAVLFDRHHRALFRFFPLRGTLSSAGPDATNLGAIGWPVGRFRSVP
jgi:hypothetical protein